MYIRSKGRISDEEKERKIMLSEKIRQQSARKAKTSKIQENIKNDQDELPPIVRTYYYPNTHI